MTPQNKDGFIKYLFDIDEDNKNELINLIQYAVIALLPILLILKAIKHFIPEEDETKGSLEIMVETVGQVVFMVGSIWFLDRIIRYIPTYTGAEYGTLKSNFIPNTIASYSLHNANKIWGQDQHSVR